MTFQRFDAEVPVGTHLDVSRDSEGAFRGLLRDDNNNLVGHAELFPVFEDEKEDALSYANSPSDTDGLSLRAVLAGLALIGLTVGAVAVAGASRDRKLRLRELESSLAEGHSAESELAGARSPVSAPAGWHDIGSGRQRWWDGQQWTAHFQGAPHRPQAPAGWYDDGSGRQRWWNGCEWTAHLQAPRDQVPRSLSAAPPAPHNNVEAALKGSKISMTSTEWQERVRAMLLARAYSEEQWRILSNARIEGANSALLTWQSELGKLTPQQFSDRMDHMLERNPSLHGTERVSVSAGWYDDGSDQQRWWDGGQWTERLQVQRVRVLSGQPAAAPAGWHRDGSGRKRWWDGRQWTEYLA